MVFLCGFGHCSIADNLAPFFFGVGGMESAFLVIPNLRYGERLSLLNERWNG
jgi:hypothetical protein